MWQALSDMYEHGGERGPIEEAFDSVSAAALNKLLNVGKKGLSTAGGYLAGLGSNYAKAVGKKLVDYSVNKTTGKFAKPKTKKKKTKYEKKDDLSESIFREKIMDLFQKEEKYVYRNVGFIFAPCLSISLYTYQGKNYYHGAADILSTPETGIPIWSTKQISSFIFKNGVPHIFNINSTSQGSTEYNRIGKKITMKRTELSFEFKWTGPTEWEKPGSTLNRKKSLNLRFSAFLVYDQEPCKESRTQSGALSLDLYWGLTHQATSQAAVIDLINWMNQIWENTDSSTEARWPSTLIRRETRPSVVNNPERFIIIKKWDWTVTPSNTSVLIDESLDLHGLKTTYRTESRGDHNIQRGALYFVLCPPGGTQLSREKPGYESIMSTAPSGMEITDSIYVPVGNSNLNLEQADMDYVYDFKNKLIFSDI